MRLYLPASSPRRGHGNILPPPPQQSLERHPLTPLWPTQAALPPPFSTLITVQISISNPHRPLEPASHPSGCLSDNNQRTRPSTLRALLFQRQRVRYYKMTTHLFCLALPRYKYISPPRRHGLFRLFIARKGYYKFVRGNPGWLDHHWRGWSRDPLESQSPRRLRLGPSPAWSCRGIGSHAISGGD